MTAPLATICATLVSAAAVQPDPAVTAGRQALDAWWWRSYPWYDKAADSVAPVDVSDPWYMKLAFWDWFEWPDWQWSGISPGGLRWPTTLMQWVAWIGIAAVLAMLVYWMIRAYRQREPARRKQKPKGAKGDSAADDRRRAEALPVGAPRVPDDLLGEAQRRYEQGDYRQAIVYLFSHQLVELDKSHLIRLTKGKTNRQYVRELGRSVPLGGLVYETMRVFEDVFFGNYALDRARFESCWRRMDEFDTLVAGESA